MGKNRKYFLFAGLSGLLLASAYPGWRIEFGWLVWVGFIPLIWSLTKTASGYDRIYRRQIFWLGFIAGLVYFSIVFRWFWSIYPLDTLGIEKSYISFIVVLLVYLISSAGMALFWGLWTLATYYLPLTTKNAGSQAWFKKLVGLLLLPATFVIFEYLRSWGFGFLWAGSGLLFGPHWTLGNLAYTLTDNQLALKFASFAGIYGVTLLIVLINYLVFAVVTNGLQRYKKMSVVMGVFLYLIIIAITFGLKLIKPLVTSQENGKQVNFTVIQTAQPTKSSPSPREMLASLEEQLKLLNQTAKEYPENQLIVFPEASDLFKNIALFLTPTQVQKYFSNLFKEPRLIITGGRVFDATGRYYSRVFSLDTKNGIENYYDKRLLTPGGEFLPYPVKLIAWLFSKTTASQFDILRELNVGTKDISTVNFREQFKVAPVICSELLSPGFTRQVSQNSDIIVSMASYGIFHGSRVIARQMLAATRFRAAEQAKPIITAANLGQSYVVDNQGKMVYLAKNGTPQILTGSIALGYSKSWYNKLGDLPIILVSLLSMLGLNFLIWFRGIRRP